MKREEIISYLYNALQPDASLRQKAEYGIMELQTKDYAHFIENIVDIFTDNRSDLQLKLISGIILKNSLHSKDESVQKVYEEKWCTMDILRRENLKTKIVTAFSTPDEKISLLAGASLGHIARIELPYNLYNDYFASMEMYLLDESKACAVYESIGICSNYLINETNFSFNEVCYSIFSITMQSLLNKATNPQVKEASLKCLMNSFEGLENVFSDETNVRHFMSGIAETATINKELAKKSLICLNRFVYLFHSLIKSKLYDIVNYINYFWPLVDEHTKIQLLEFWTIICEAGYVDVINEHLNFTLKYVLNSLEKGEDYNDESWNQHKAASSCLEAINSVIREKLLQNRVVLDFIDEKIMSGDPKRIDIGAVALGSAISEDLEQQLVQYVKILINKMRDPICEESCLWALAKVCETNFYAVVEHLPCLISQTCEIILSGYQTATSSAWILSSIFQSLKKYKEIHLLPLHIPIETQRQFLNYAYTQINQHFTYILQVLIKSTENAKLEDSTLRVALFSALSELIKLTNESNCGLLDEFINYCIQKINECVVAVNRASANYIPIIEDVLSNYVILSEVISQERNKNLSQEGNKNLSQERNKNLSQEGNKNSSELLISPYIDILKSRPTTSIGEVYIAISNNVEGFSPHINTLLPYISRDLSCLDEFILKAAINLIGCLANHMQTDFFQASTSLIPLLIQTLSSKEMPKKLKPSIISVFGDIALALGRHFKQYLAVSFMIFDQILSLDRSTDEKYIDSLRNNVIVMTDCIIISINDTHTLGDHICTIVEGIKKLTNTSNSSETKLSILNLLNDLKNLYGNNYELNGRWVETFLYDCVCTGNSKLVLEANNALEAFKYG